jgi:hypothetical protein
VDSISNKTGHSVGLDEIVFGSGFLLLMALGIVANQAFQFSCERLAMNIRDAEVHQKTK